jgi:hypothetical protein
VDRPTAPHRDASRPIGNVVAVVALPTPPVAQLAAEPRQRWRLTFARDPVPADQVGRAALDAWQAMLAGSGLPVAGLEPGGPGRARIAFAAPLPAGACGAAELADLWLLERRPLWALREALAKRLPAAHRWIGAEDVWLGAPPLAGRVSAADWRIEVGDADLSCEPAISRDRLAEAARALIAARTLSRVRVKGTTEKRYDLRPLLADVRVDPADGSPAPGADTLVVRVRTRIHPELGAGRPEEVIAALAETAGLAIEIVATTRERLVLADDLPVPRRR